MKKLFFDHIYKCGGTSIIKLLIKKFIDPNFSLTDFKGPISLATKLYNEYIMISGHFWFSPKEKPPRDRFCFTLLRDPIDRILSHYFYIKNISLGSPSSAPGFSTVKNSNLYDYFFSQDTSILSLIENAQTQHFYPIEWDGKTQITDIEKLNLAKKL